MWETKGVENVVEGRNHDKFILREHFQINLRLFYTFNRLIISLKVCTYERDINHSGPLRLYVLTLVLCS